MNKKGISLLMLSTFVVVLIIIATTVSIAGANVLNDAKKIKFATELTYMQELVDNYKTSHDGQYPTGTSVVLRVNSVTTKEKVQFNEETQNAGNITLYAIDKTKLGIANTTYGNPKNDTDTDVYAVSKETGRVYYAKGLKIGNRTYFTLTEDLKAMIEYDGAKKVMTQDGIIFNPSSDTWTNQNITVEIKVPASYSSITISAYQNEKLKLTITSPIASDANYKTFQVKGLIANYDIEIAYQKPENGSNINKKIEYAVNKVDKEPPSLEISIQQEMHNAEENLKQTYLKINVKDNMGPLKILKYEQENIPEDKAKSYFANNGTPIKDDTIIADKSAKYVTVYAEDQAGNFVVKSTKINVLMNDKDYVKISLLAQFDGVNNTGNGHDATTTTWKDLSNHANDATLYNFKMNEQNGWKVDGLQLSGYGPNESPQTEYVYFPLSLPQYSSFTLDFCFVDRNHQNSMFIGANTFSGESWNAFTFLTGNVDAGIWDGSIVSGGNYLGDSGTPSAESRFGIGEIPYKTEVGKVTTLTYTFNSTNKVASVYINGVKKASKTFVNRPHEIFGFNIKGQGDYKRICVYNRVLTDSEITQNYTTDKARFIM